MRSKLIWLTWVGWSCLHNWDSWSNSLRLFGSYNNLLSSRTLWDLYKNMLVKSRSIYSPVEILYLYRGDPGGRVVSRFLLTWGHLVYGGTRNPTVPTFGRTVFPKLLPSSRRSLVLHVCTYCGRLVIWRSDAERRPLAHQCQPRDIASRHIKFTHLYF